MINFCMFPLLLLKQQVFFGINIPESDGNRKSWVKFLATPSDLTIDDGLHFWLGTYGGFRFVMGVPPVLIHFLLGFSLTIQLLGYPHDETETCIWSFLQMGWEVLMKNHQRKFSWHTSELRAHVHGQFCHHVNHGRQFAGGNSIHRAPEKSRFIGYNLPKRSYYFTGNHGFNHQIWGFPLNQPNDICST
jgi:hypothetical protein